MTGGKPVANSAGRVLNTGMPKTHEVLPHKAPPGAHGTSDLTYYIYEGLLTGYSNGHMVHIMALSGGGGGSTRNKTVASVNNPYMEGLKTIGTGKTHVHGGPIPPGSYEIETPSVHPHLGLSARLDHKGGAKPMGRDGFYIHGQGPHGSDGCIVPIEGGAFHRLMKDLKATEGGHLVVAEKMDGSMFA